MSPAATAGTTAAVPTRTQVQQWDTKDLDAAATRWRNAAASGETAFETHRQNILNPGGTAWEGDAKDAALDRMTADLAVARRQGEAQRVAAEIAAQGAQDIAGARRQVLEAIAEAEADGFEVGDDLSVTDTRAYDAETAAARVTAATEHAEYIRWRAEQLAATDALVGQQLRDKAAELEGIRFDGETAADGRDPTIQLVDNKTEAAGPDAEEPGKTWQDMLLPPDTTSEPAGDAGAEPATDAADEAKSPLDELLVPEKTTDPNQPKNLNDALDEVAGQPVPAAAGPRLDPAKVEEFKATARRLMQQDGVPADQIEQRLNDMVANAQKPLVPMSHPDEVAPPRPTFGEGVADRWHEMEDSAHDLTGQNGWDAFKDSWKNLGTGLAETAMDPYGTAARNFIDDAEMARRYPEYWLGGKAVDLGAAAATLPFGGEGAAAARLGALDDVARSGIPREVIDVPRGSPDFDHPTPLAPQHPSAMDGPGLHHPPAGGDLAQVHTDSGGKGAWNYELNNPAPNTHYVVDDRYHYTTDSHGRSASVEGPLDPSGAHERNSYQQRIAGGDDRLPGDQGGHIIGSQFHGPGEAINLTAMRDDLNSVGTREYYQMESEWRQLLNEGRHVEVKVDIGYPGDSRRPDSYLVKTFVDGKLYATRDFDN